jgi:membrane associated rhomboid family serine protease
VKHSIREELRGVLAFVGVVWCVFLVSRVLPFNINALGVTPRSLIGLVGIPLMPFLHADFGHLMSNTFPLTILLVLLAGSKANSWGIVLYIVLLGGLLVWLFGRPATHVGASGLIYGLIAFLLLSGFLEQRFAPLMVSLLVGFLYGATLLFGIVPDLGSHVSWEGHLCGAIAGGVAARGLVRDSEPRDMVAK